MSQLTTPLTKEIRRLAVSLGRVPKQIFLFRFPSVWTRTSMTPGTAPATTPRRPSPVRRLAIAVAVTVGFFAVPTVSGMPLTDFAEMIGVAVVLRESITFALHQVSRGSGEAEAAAGTDSTAEPEAE